jgi:hypothetical protein
MVLVITLAIFAMFLPVVIVRYAFTDDYPILFIADGLGSSPWFSRNLFETQVTGGRPLAGLLQEFFFSAAGTIDNLRFVRLVGVVGIVALALLLHWALVRSGIKPALAALFAVLICSMPVFQVYGSWTVLFVAPYAAILGGGASLLAGSAVEEPRGLVANRVVGATAMLLAALLIYQPPSMSFWVFLAIAVVGARHDSRRTLRLARTHFGVAAVALALAFLTTKVAVHLLGSTTANSARNALTHDPIGKARWFLNHPLYQSLNLFDLTPSPWFAVVVVIVAAGGILLLLDREGVRPLLYVGIAVVLIPLSFLPSLVVEENSPTFRVQGALSSLVALYFCLGAVGVWLAARDRLELRLNYKTLIAADRVTFAAAAAFVAASAYAAATNITTLGVEPQSTELRIIRSQVAAIPTGATRVAFVMSGWYQGMTTPLFEELGLPSSAVPWTAEPAVLLILREEGRLAPEGQRPIVDILPWYTTVLPKDEPVIDLRGLERLR